MQGSPSQGLVNTEDIAADDNNIESISPETFDQIGAPETSTLDTFEQFDIQSEQDITSIPPEESIDVGPINSTPETLPVEQTDIEEQSPEEEVLLAARPEESLIISEDITQIKLQKK